MEIDHYYSGRKVISDPDAGLLDEQLWFSCDYRNGKIDVSVRTDHHDFNKVLSTVWGGHDELPGSS